MISTPDREEAVKLIDEAVVAGARRHKACEELGVSVRTVQRWTQDGGVCGDGRPDAVRPVPANKLSDAERAAVLALCNEPRYASVPPTQIVPREADEGRYTCSERSMYRILHEHDAQHHRGRAKAPGHRGDARSHLASRPNEVWCWDCTWLPGPVRGSFMYLYAIMDVFSRKVVAWEVYDHESGEHASLLVKQAVLREGTLDQPLVLHADNGSPQKSATLRATLEALGIIASYSRPRVSNDNAYIESLFRTGKYRPGYPVNGFDDIDAAREWVGKLFRWYNHEHRHSAIRFVTPTERHDGREHDILSQRQAVYAAARKRHPQRWKNATRNWAPVGPVWLNKPADRRAEQSYR